MTDYQLAPLEIPRDAAEALYAALGAALGVGRDEGLAGLRAEADQLNRDCDGRDETIRHLDAGLTHERTRADQAEELLDIAHQTSNRAEAGRARAVAEATAYRQHVARLEEELVAARSVVDRVRALAPRLAAHAVGFQDVLDDTDRGPWGRTVGADIAELTAVLAGDTGGDR